jgi:REP element-mobilizing transposase RayT
MPRLARPIFAGVAHHITQRGNRRENVFFSDADREAYLEWLRDYGAKHGVELLAYCLMTNHIHVVAVPEREDSLERVFRPLHTRYAQRINRAKRWKGICGRGDSSPRRWMTAICGRRSATWSATRCGRAWCVAPRTTAGRARRRTAALGQIPC